MSFLTGRCGLMQLLSPLVELHLPRSKTPVWMVISSMAHCVTRAPRTPCRPGPLVQTLSFRSVYVLCKTKQKPYLEKGARPVVCGLCVPAEEPISALPSSVFPLVWGKSPPRPYLCHRGVRVYMESVSRQRVLVAEWSRLPQVNK